MTNKHINIIIFFFLSLSLFTFLGLSLDLSLCETDSVEHQNDKEISEQNRNKGENQKFLRENSGSIAIFILIGFALTVVPLIVTECLFYYWGR